MNKKNIIIGLAALSAMFFVYGCAAGNPHVRLYEGTELAQDKVCLVEKIDGHIKTHAFNNIPITSIANTMEILPGEHSLTLSFYAQGPKKLIAPFPATPKYAWYEFKSDANQVITFKSIAGHRYALSSVIDLNNLQWKPIIIDKTQGNMEISTGEIMTLIREIKEGGDTFSEIQYMNRLNQTFGRPRR